MDLHASEDHICRRPSEQLLDRSTARECLDLTQRRRSGLQTLDRPRDRNVYPHRRQFNCQLEQHVRGLPETHHIV